MLLILKKTEGREPPSPHENRPTSQGASPPAPPWTQEVQTVVEEWTQTTSTELDEFKGFLRELGEADARMAGWDGVDLETWKTQQLGVARASTPQQSADLDLTNPKAFAELINELRRRHPGRTVRKRDVHTAVRRLRASVLA